MTCFDTYSKVYYEKKDSHVKDAIVARGSIQDLRNHNINSQYYQALSLLLNLTAYDKITDSRVEF